MNHDSLVLTVKMVRGNECSNAKMLRGSPSRLSETVPAHYLTFVIRSRQRLLEMDDCLASPAPPRRRRHTGGATWVDVRCDRERLRHMISKIRARQYTRNRHAQPVVSAAKGDAHFRSMLKCSLDFHTTSTAHPSVSTSGTSKGVG